MRSWRKQFLPANDTDNGFILAHIVLHLFLDECVVLDQILQVLLTVKQVLLQLCILIHEVFINPMDFSAVATHLGQLATAIGYSLVYFFYMEEKLLMRPLSSACFSASILSRLALCLVSFRFFSFWYSISM
jgi:hypothetical protein